MTNTAEESDQEKGLEGEADNAVPAAPDSLVVKIFKAIGLGPKPAVKPDPDGKAAAPKPPVKQTRAAAMARPAVPMPAGSLSTVVIRNEFYRDGFRNLIKIAILEAVIIVILILSLIVYMNNAKSQDRYFATTADGRIMQLVPLDQPNLSPAALMSWVANAAVEVMTFGFHDYQRRMQQSSRHFTKPGWESFTTALQKAKILDSVQGNQQVVTAAPMSAPVLRKQGVVGGKYRWLIEMPLQITYRAGSVTRQDQINLQLIVERVPSLENPNGIGIAQWIGQQR